MKKVIGFKAVLDALRKGRLLGVKIDPSKRKGSSVRELVESGVKIEWSETPNGIEGFVDFKIKGIDNLIEELSARERATVVILDHLQDTGNLGAIIRSADAFGVDLIVLPNKNSVRVNDDVIKISTGSAANINIIEVPNLFAIIEKLKENGFWIYGSDAKGERNYRGAFEKKSCIVMGSEADGMRKRIREACDFLVSIPIRIDSLNVAHACSILLCEAYNN